jgi:signal transduction histidine kinase
MDPARRGPPAPAAEAPDRLAALGDRLLELAVVPDPDADAVAAARRDLAVLAAADWALATDTAAARHALVETAAALLDAPDPVALEARLGAAVEAHALLSALEGAGDRPLTDAERAAVEAHLGGDPEPSALAADLTDLPALDDDRLRDAALLVRRFAVLDRLRARTPKVAAACASTLLGLPEERVLARLASLAPAPLVAPGEWARVERPQLRARIDHHRRLAALLPGAAASPADLLESASRLMRTPAALAVVDGDDLVVHGADDLAGTRIPLEAERSLVAGALVQRVPAFLAGDGGATAVDQQLARRLGGRGLLAAPLASGSGAVLIVAGDADRYAALAFAARAPAPVAAADDADVVPRQRLREAVHEIGNPLAVVRNTLHVIGRRLPADDAAAADALRVTGEELARASRLLRALVDVGPESAATAPPAPVLLEDVRTALAALATERGVALEVAAADELPAPAVAADPLRQVLGNLVRNAVEALEPGGTVRLVAEGPLATPAGPVLVLEVCDDGPGLPPERRADPFVAGPSEKGAERGLGLSIVARLVAGIGGSIEVAAPTGGGTCFRVRVPAAR